MESTHVLLSSFHLNGHTKGFQISLTGFKNTSLCKTAIPRYHCRIRNAYRGMTLQ